MRVGVDANLSFRTVNALSAVFSDSERLDAPTFECVGSGPAESDVMWISQFASDGGSAIIGVDRRIIAKPHEIRALHEAGLSACFLDFGQNGAKLHFQTGAIVNLWPRLNAIWIDARNPIILRAKVLPSLSWHQIEELQFEMDGDVPRVRHMAFRED